MLPINSKVEESGVRGVADLVSRSSVSGLSPRHSGSISPLTITSPHTLYGSRSAVYGVPLRASVSQPPVLRAASIAVNSDGVQYYSRPSVGSRSAVASRVNQGAGGADLYSPPATEYAAPTTNLEGDNNSMAETQFTDSIVGQIYGMNPLAPTLPHASSETSQYYVSGDQRYLTPQGNAGGYEQPLGERSGYAVPETGSDTSSSGYARPLPAQHASSSTGESMYMDSNAPRPVTYINMQGDRTYINTTASREQSIDHTYINDGAQQHAYVNKVATYGKAPESVQQYEVLTRRMGSLHVPVESMYMAEAAAAQQDASYQLERTATGMSMVRHRQQWEDEDEMA